ncbi:MAG: envelope integrity protein Cei [Actinomycetota bacterium]|nr:envelope integrity protein Cei [Actinomycetota bacterium]
MAAVGSFGARPGGHRARRPVRAVLLAVVLGTAAGLIWLGVLHPTEGGCQASEPAAQASSSQRLPANSLDAVPPAPPQFVRVQVLNANGVRGEATIVDGELAQLGFAPTTTPANDPLYPAFDLRCYGEIRFGNAGQAAARTLSLAVPCAELVRDARPDAEVDLALGTKFIALRPNDAARTALLSLAGLGPSVPAGSFRGGLAAESDPQSMTPESMTPEQMTQSAVPVVNPNLLLQARQVKC